MLFLSKLGRDLQFYIDAFCEFCERFQSGYFTDHVRTKGQPLHLKIQNSQVCFPHWAVGFCSALLLPGNMGPIIFHIFMKP